jgi:hypothetical protein
VVAAGENLRDDYWPGDRFIVQADIFVDGVGYAYGYELQGGLSQYSVIDQRVLNGDEGNYLLPVQPGTGYAESALSEPWACVTAAYALKYRTGLKSGGVTWIIGTGESQGRNYTIGSGFDEISHPSGLLLTNVPPAFSDWLRSRGQAYGIEVNETPDINHPAVEEIDDIVILGTDPDLVETVSPHLAKSGILAIITDQPFQRPVNVDIGRIHYNRWVIVGGTDPDVARAYADVPVRSELKPGAALGSSALAARWATCTFNAPCKSAAIPGRSCAPM